MAAGAGVAIEPAAGPGLVYVAACWVSPGVAVAAALAASLLALPVLVGMPHPELVTAVSGLGLAVAAAGELLNRQRTCRASSRAALPLVLFSLALAFLVVSAIGSVPASQAATGVRIFVTPVLVLIVCLGLGDVAIRRLLRLSVALVAMNAVAAIMEMLMGVPALLAYGLQYGTNVRQIGGVLRAPGLTATNFDLGLTAASLGVGYFALLRAQQRMVSSRLLVAGLALATLCVVLSATRTALVLLLVGVGASSLSERMSKRLSWRIAASVGLVVVSALAFGRLVGFDTTSLRQRLGLWQSLLHGTDYITGTGVGSVGAATRSRFSSGHYFVVADNYYLSTFLQGGAFALLAFCAALALLAIRSLQSTLANVGIGLLAAVTVSMMFLESWEYAGYMSATFMFVSICLRAPRRSESTSGGPVPSMHVRGDRS